MNRADFRELQSFVSSLTAKTKVPWCLTQEPPNVSGADLVVRVNPMDAAGNPEMRSPVEILRLHSGVTVAEAKAKIIDRLAEGSEPSA